MGQIKLPPSFSNLWSQNEVSENIAQVWQRMIQSIYKRKGGEEYDPTRDRQKKEAETTEGQPHGIDVGTLAEE